MFPQISGQKLIRFKSGRRSRLVYEQNKAGRFASRLSTLPCYAQLNRHTEQMLATVGGLKLGMYGGKGFITAHSTEIAH